MNLRGDLPPFPVGWYAMCFASELDRDAAYESTWLGRRVRVSRDVHGRPEAHDEAGRALAVRERHQAIIGWHHPDGRAPTWEVQAPDETSWPPYLEHVFETLRSHPQETSENSVDVAHFQVVHGYSDIETVDPAEAHGPVLRAAYRFRRPMFPGAPRQLSNYSEMRIGVYGLGFSLVETTEVHLGLHTRQLVLSTPTDPGHITLRIGATVQHPADTVWGRTFSGAARAFMMRALTSDVADDFDIWQHKRYVDRPIVVPGDGPLHLYRRWARQFYPEPVDARATTGTQQASA